MTPLEYVQQRKIVAIVRGLKPEYIVRLGHAFEEGGIGLMEVPYDQRRQKPGRTRQPRSKLLRRNSVTGCWSGPGR